MTLWNQPRGTGLLKSTARFARSIGNRLQSIASARVYFGRVPTGSKTPWIVICPYRQTLFGCGLAGLVSVKINAEIASMPVLAEMDAVLERIRSTDFAACSQQPRDLDPACYLGGKDTLADLHETVRQLKRDALFHTVFNDSRLQEDLARLADEIDAITADESDRLRENMGLLESDVVDTMSRRLDLLKDIAWCIKKEVLENVEKIKGLMQRPRIHWSPSFVQIFAKINSVLNSIDRLEVRGRDSAGISLMFVLEASDFNDFETSVEEDGLLSDFQARQNQPLLVNGGISCSRRGYSDGDSAVCICMVYKVAAEIGSLGDNIRFLRQEIFRDKILQRLAGYPHRHNTILSHTRWASVGAITPANCHPLDNRTLGASRSEQPIIHACLNGDIDNYLELREMHSARGVKIAGEISTDTKIIPLQIEMYMAQGFDVPEAFRRAVNDFSGSHAIAMHTDLAPGSIFLAQRGSGQALFIGLARDHLMPASEVYGFVEQTPYYLKLDGETQYATAEGKTQGQIFILNPEDADSFQGVRAMHYNGIPFPLDHSQIKCTEISSRDIDRQDYPHYFLKEISEAPQSIAKTLQNRWKIDRETGRYVVNLDPDAMPVSIRTALQEDRIRRVYFVGQGTAGVAAQSCAAIMSYYLDSPLLPISAMKASELSGFSIHERDGVDSMRDALVIAISQSGTTADTNRTVDMVRERGAHTLAIVNRRDSDLTFKVDGVVYTSSGRDIEMSVASTKAFYSQIIAGALLGLQIAVLKGRRSSDFVAAEIERLLAIPDHMRNVLAHQEPIARSAARLAVAKTYWAAVGSGPNKAAADEIRIKLSELCYKTISSDYVEDKKHIDLSSEPLIIVCSAGLRSAVLGDIIKDTAIFKAHKAAPVVIADEGEERFRPYAEDVFQVPRVAEHLAPLLNTLAGHIWGYYAALAINDGSRFFYRFKETIQQSIDSAADRGLDVYEVVLEKSFRAKIAQFYSEFRSDRNKDIFPRIMGADAASDLTLLLKYLAGRLPVSDFELDFGIKGTASNMLQTLFECLARAINATARPVDAIKHQAKTVTVGTSRIREKVEGILFEALASHRVDVDQLTPSNVIVLKNLQRIISAINGSIFYGIAGLDYLGETTDETTIAVIEKRGLLKSIPSRVESDPRLKGTKQIIVRQGNVYIGKGRRDDRSILVIPIISRDGGTPNRIEHLLLLNISFKSDVPLKDKIKALGGKYDHIKNIVLESSLPWQDAYLEQVKMDELFGRSAEKIGEFIAGALT